MTPRAPMLDALRVAKKDNFGLGLVLGALLGVFVSAAFQNLSWLAR